jgi:anti-anti-sigma regulatory factor
LLNALWVVGHCFQARIASFGIAAQGLGGVMLVVHIENIRDMAIVECRGRIVRSEAAFNLRKAVTSQTQARVVALDLTEVRALDGGGLGMLQFLQYWARDHHIQLKLFGPIDSVKNKLEQTGSAKFDIATSEEMMVLLACADRRYGVAA